MPSDEEVGPQGKAIPRGADNTTPASKPSVSRESNGDSRYPDPWKQRFADLGLIPQPNHVDPLTQRFIDAGLVAAPPTAQRRNNHAVAIDPWKQRLIDYGLAAPQRRNNHAVASDSGRDIDYRDRAYGQAALRDEADRLAHTASYRNDTLRDITWKLVGFVNTGALTEGEYRDALLNAGRQASGLGDHPFTDSEINGILNRALDGRAAHHVRRAPDDTDVVDVAPGTLGGVEETPNTGDTGQDSATPTGNNEPPLYADRILTRTDLRALPDPEPLIDNVLDQGTTALLYGHRGTYKTFIARTGRRV
ncbi:hypothetical protein [Mycolicibacterium setense]